MDSFADIIINSPSFPYSFHNGGKVIICQNQV